MPRAPTCSGAAYLGLALIAALSGCGLGVAAGHPMLGPKAVLLALPVLAALSLAAGRLANGRRGLTGGPFPVVGDLRGGGPGTASLRSTTRRRARR